MKQAREAITSMQRIFAALETSLTGPVLVPKGTREAFRYVDKSAPQAIVEKLARIVSGASAIDLLMEHGFLQEGATPMRGSPRV